SFLHWRALTNANRRSFSNMLTPAHIIVPAGGEYGETNDHASMAHRACYAQARALANHAADTRKNVVARSSAGTPHPA
ncbi:MAG TPA: hypothetical protein VF099_01640, partial [Ktedonobacterales bacterium]